MFMCITRKNKPIKEVELVSRKIMEEKKEMAEKGEKYLSREEALSKYR